jgi:hypothetical protein
MHRKGLLFLLIGFPAVMLTAPVPSIAHAATYFVDPSSGNDTADGSAEHPWRTIARTQRDLTRGDIIILMPADYGDVVFTPAKKGENGDYATYRSAPAKHGRAVFSHIAFRNADMHIAIEGCEIENTGTHDSCIQVENASAVRIVACKIHGQLNAAGPTHANVVVRNSKNVLIDRCEIYCSGPSAHGVQMEGSNAVTVRGCHVHDIVSSGIRTHGGEDYTIEHNIVHDQQADWNPSVHGSGISVRSHGTTLRSNIIYNYGNTRPIRFYPDYAGPEGYRNMRVENNLVYKTLDFHGVQWWTEFLDVGPNCVFCNNTFVGDVVMILATRSDGSGLSLFNNIVTGRLQLDPSQKWPNIRHGNNILGQLASKGCGWLCFRSDFTPGGSNKVGTKCTVGGFFKNGAAHYPYIEGPPYQLNGQSPAVDWASDEHAPPTDLLCRPRRGRADAGCFEQIPPP